MSANKAIGTRSYLLGVFLVGLVAKSFNLQSPQFDVPDFHYSFLVRMKQPYSASVIC